MEGIRVQRVELEHSTEHLTITGKYLDYEFEMGLMVTEYENFGFVDVSATFLDWIGATPEDYQQIERELEIAILKRYHAGEID